MEARSLRTPVSGVGDEDGDWDVGEGEEGEEDVEGAEEVEGEGEGGEGEEVEVEDDGGGACHREAFSTAHFRSSLTKSPPSLSPFICC